jgi:3-oxoacyl-[acyl-carrier-protein] synthase II
MQSTKVVITGLGVISPLGIGVEKSWEGLISGRSAVGPITCFDAANFPVSVAAEVKGFAPQDFIDYKTARRTGRFVQFAIAATDMAVKSARLDMTGEIDHRVGICIGSVGDSYRVAREVDIIKERGPRRIDPFLMTKLSSHTAATQVGCFIGARGPSININSACASGSDALGTALNHLRLGHADVMLSGGAESMINPLVVGLLGVIGALTKEADPIKACRPFDLNRDGFVLAEGAGMLVLETYEHAKRREAPILAELAGAGWSFDAWGDVAPNPEGQALAMAAALRDAGITPEEVDYINTHGTSTKLNDAAETKAIKSVFGEHAYKIPLSSNKSMLGHSVAAAGAIEAIASVLSIVNGILPPTINYETPDPECDLDCIPNVARHAEVNAVLSNSFGLGGQNCCLVIRSFNNFGKSLE